MVDIVNKLAKNTGNLIVVTGILHLILGAAEHWGTMLEIISLGVFNTATVSLQTFGFFWFQVNGLFVIFIGLLIQHNITEYKKQIPKKFGWYLFLIALFGCLLEPLSGFYVFMLISLLIIFQKNIQD